MEKLYKKRILFIGMPDFGSIALERLIKENFNIVGVIVPHKSDPSYNYMKSFALNLNANVIDYEETLKDNDFLNKLSNLDIDIAICCSYNKKFPKELLNIPKDGIINCHPSLLPLYRGANPYSAVIMNDEKETGITLHYMDENIDTGNIITQYTVPIESNETMGTLFNKLNYLSCEIIVKTLKKYEEIGKLDSTPQAKGDYPYAPNINPAKADNYINWEKYDAYSIERFIRALNPFIQAMSTYKGLSIRIHSAFVKNKKVKCKPGSICDINDYLGIATKDGILYIKILQIGTYLICDAKEFIRRFNPQKGERFGY